MVQIQENTEDITPYLDTFHAVDLFLVLLQFKFHKVALIADIEKEFLSIEVKRNRLGYFQVFVGRRSNRDFHKKSQESALELLVGWDI